MFTNKKITSALIEAKKRGVDVEIVIEKSSFDAEKILNKFKSKAVDAKLSKKPVLLHHKFALIDDSILILGSANWTYSAFYINDDDFIIIHDMTDSQKRYLEKLWKKIILEAL